MLVLVLVLVLVQHLHVSTLGTLPTGLLTLYLTLLDLILPSLVVDMHVPTYLMFAEERERERGGFFFFLFDIGI